MDSEEKNHSEKSISLIVYALLPIGGFLLPIITFVLYQVGDLFENLLFRTVFLLFLPAILLLIYVKKNYFFLYRFNRGLILYRNNPENSEFLKDPVIKQFSDIIIESVKESIERKYINKFYNKQSDIKALQSQINPHFLYNTLDSIRGKALMHNQNEIADMTEALARFFRYSISRKGNMVTLLDEIKNVDTYINIQKFRFGDKFDIIKEFEEEDYNNILIPKLTLQPIIENAIHHGIEMSEKKGIISIRIDITDERVLIRISDNGIGIDNEKLEVLNKSLRKKYTSENLRTNESEHGIALENVNDRIRLQFGESYGITIYSIKDLGTDVELRIPLERPQRDFFTGENSNFQ